MLCKCQHWSKVKVAVAAQFGKRFLPKPQPKQKAHTNTPPPRPATHTNRHSPLSSTAHSPCIATPTGPSSLQKVTWRNVVLAVALAVAAQLQRSTERPRRKNPTKCRPRAEHPLLGLPLARVGWLWGRKDGQTVCYDAIGKHIHAIINCAAEEKNTRESG